MGLKHWIVGVAAAAVASVAFAQPAGEMAAAAFRRLRAEGVAAVNAGDFRTAEARLAAAGQVIPNHPGLLVLQAKVRAAQDDLPGAIAIMDRYARLGLTIDAASDEVLQRVFVETDFAPVARLLAANALPVGKLETEGQIDGAWLAEAVAWDAKRKRWLISGVHGRSIVAVKGKKLSRFLAADSGADGVLGLVLDARRDVLWAATAGLPQAKDLAPERKGRSALLKIDASSGRVLARLEAPAGGHSFGDVLLSPDGTVFLSDSATGEIFRAGPDAKALERVLPAGRIASPQGLVLAADGKRLIVADYTSGLYLVDPATGSATMMQAVETAALVGIDGLIAHDGGLIAIQNGVSPQRVLRLDLDPGGTRITGWRVLAANHPILQEPTTGVIVGDDLVLIARSQWTDFRADGTLSRNPPGPAVLARLKLR